MSVLHSAIPSLFVLWSTLFSSLLMSPTEAPLQASYEELTKEEQLQWQATVEALLSTGIEFSYGEEKGAIPAQNKDLFFTKSSEEELWQLRLGSDFTNYVIETIQTQIEKESSDLTLLEADANQISKVRMEGQVEDGVSIQESLLRAELFKSIASGEVQIEVPARIVKGEVINSTGIDLGPLEEIAEGKSTFWGSSPEREFNIKKAINEKFNGILIPPGAEFSYVEWLGPIEYAGWKQAYTIFQGTKLEKAPAGGVCQISTTIYRAALDAGLELTEQRAHSLYVIYYNDYGDGLDATIFPGEQDLKFVNNSPNYLLMTATEEGYYEAVVRLYGENTGKETTLIGPYTASNQTEETLTELGQMGIGEMAWKYIITFADGTSEEKWIHNSYFSQVTQHKNPPRELDTNAPPENKPH